MRVVRDFANAVDQLQAKLGMNSRTTSAFLSMAVRPCLHCTRYDLYTESTAYLVHDVSGTSQLHRRLVHVFKTEAKSDTQSWVTL